MVTKAKYQAVGTSLYYLQSRYYNPEVGRFINADAFATTGQGVLGNNMFLYCSNNAVNCFDPTGQYMVATDFEIYGGGVAGLVGSPGGGGANAVIQEMARNSTNQTTAFSPGKRDKEELWQEVKGVYRDFQELYDVYNSLPDIYPEIRIYQGGEKIYNGVNKIIEGGGMLLAPATVLEDLWGVGLATVGIIQAAGGIAEMIIGFARL